MTKVLMCDPPMGWKYGFPKPLPDLYYEMGENFELEMWLVSEGYPREELFRLAHVGCRYWLTSINKHKLEESKDE